MPPGGRRRTGATWGVLATCDAAYFTAQDPLALQAARGARVVTARRREAPAAPGVRAGVVVDSALDPREAAPLPAFPTTALVLTEGRDGGSIQTASGTVRFATPAGRDAPASDLNGVGGSDGAGDSFAGALAWHLAAGVSLPAACAAASWPGAAALSSPDPVAAHLTLPAAQAMRSP